MTAKRVVIAGGSGQIGHVLTRAFVKRGDDVCVLSRRPLAASGFRSVQWDGKGPGDWVAELEGADVLINLAGFTVNCRYNTTNRDRIMKSRVESTRALREAVAGLNHPPPVWLNASTATIYRHALDKPMDDETGELGGNEPGAPEKWNFSIAVAKAWEAEFFEGELPGVRRVALRSAMTMSPDRGGVFDVMLSLVRVGLGGTNGNGRQFVSWIHEYDFVRAVEFCIEREDIDGTINLTSPNPIPNREFMRTLRQAWGIPIGLPATAWMMEIGAIFMKTETELVLKSRRVVPSRLQSLGFKFEYPHWKDAAKELCERRKSRAGA